MNIRLGLHLGFITSVAAILVAWNQVGVPRAVRIDLNGEVTTYQTRQVRVAEFLKEAGVQLQPGDRVIPPTDSLVPSSGTITVTRAVPLSVTVAGAVREGRSAAATVGDALKDLGITPGPFDLILLQGSPATPNTRLASPVTQGRVVRPVSNASAIALEVRPARSVTIHDGSLVFEMLSVAPTVGQALDAAGIELRPEDITRPPPSQRVEPGQQIYLQRASDVTLHADGRERTIYTQAQTVGEALKQAGVRLGPDDMVVPALDEPVVRGLQAQVTRVRQESYIEDEALPYETRSLPDGDLEVGKQRVDQPGSEGLYRRQYRVRYEDGEEVARTLEREWIEVEPQPRVVYYGTKVIPYFVDTGLGSLQYSRTLRVYATYYRPSTSGKPRGAPGYGITSTGMRAQHGVIAVDPRVIPYYTRVYIPGYGVAVAGDTGGGIIGNRIDLAYGDDEPVNWRTGWVDIYILN